MDNSFAKRGFVKQNSNPSYGYYINGLLKLIEDSNSELGKGNREAALRRYSRAAEFADKALEDRDLTVGEAETIAGFQQQIIDNMDLVRRLYDYGHVLPDTFGEMKEFRPGETYLRERRNNPRNKIIELNDWKKIKREHPRAFVRSRAMPAGVTRLALWGRGQRKHVVPISYRPYRNPRLAAILGPLAALLALWVWSRK